VLKVRRDVRILSVRPAGFSAKCYFYSQEVTVMKIAKRRCDFCHRWFMPHPRTYRQQRCCSKPECRKKQKVRTKKNWWLKNPGYNRDRRQKIRAWAKEHPDYWRRYRREHPEYVARDNKRRSSMHKKQKNAAKQDPIRKISVEKLKSIMEIEPNIAAKQDPIQRRQNGILDYLYWKEFAAKQDIIDSQADNGQ